MLRRLSFALLLLGATPTALVVTAFVAIAPASVAARVTPAATASATRAGGDVSLEWSGLTGPVDIFLLEAPDSSRKSGKRLATGVTATSAVVPAAAWPRPYFLLRDSRGTEVRAAERLLPLEGGSNFRDLGGYRTTDGSEVRWGKLYRSAVMSGLTPDDLTHLGKLGIETVCDFRSTDERQRDPVTWPAGVQPTILATDYGLDMGALSSLFQSGPVNAETTMTAMEGFYREMPFGFADQYARMMRALADGKAPLAFNCSAGKDRTGLAAALLLTVLGVSKETAITDYLLSNTYYQPKPPAAGTTDPTTAMFAKLPPDVIKALMGVDRRYLEASFAAIEEKGGMDRYTATQLQLTPADVAKLKQLYLSN